MSEWAFVVNMSGTAIIILDIITVSNVSLRRFF